MPDLKDKNSSSRLNPSEKDFEDIVDQPAMQALDDRGDAIARNDDTASKLRGSENNPTTDNSTDEGRKQSKDQQKPDNKYGYEPQKQAPEQKSGGLFSTKKT